MFNIFRRLFPRNRKKDTNAHLKKTGRRLVVRVEDCAIRAFVNWEDQASIFSSEVQMLDAVAGALDANKSKTEGSYIQYDHPLENGQIQRMQSPFIQKDKATLSFVLLQMREISIYINPANPAEYYFDLEDITFSV